MRSASLYPGAFICSLLLLTGCGKVSFESANGNTDNASTAGSASQAQIRVSMNIRDSGNNVIYSDANSSSSLVLKSGQNYNLMLNPSARVAGAAYSLVLTQTDLVNAAPQAPIALFEGANSFSVATPGDYSLKMIVTAPAMMTLTKYYAASVTCASPTFTGVGLNANAISVSPGSGNNLFNLSAAGIANGANGQAPFLCAWDPTGSGIIDTGFKDCASVFSNFYSNYVGNRNVSVVVKDACNSVHTVSKLVALPYTVPAIGNQIVFIAGQVSGATGFAATDKRVNNVTYLATNPSGNKVVTSTYSAGNFTIEASKNYGLASSVPFGMKLSITGISGNLDLASGTGTLDAGDARIKAITYSTDQAGDSAMALAFSGQNCTLSNQNAKVMFASGTPCAPPQTGSGNKVTVEVYGNYTCTGLSSTGAVINISGSFDGLDTLADSCIGGGGGGGGGIVPIKL